MIIYITKLYRVGVLTGNLPAQDRQAMDNYLAERLRVGMTEAEVAEILMQIGN